VFVGLTKFPWPRTAFGTGAICVHVAPPSTARNHEFDQDTFCPRIQPFSRPLNVTPTKLLSLYTGPVSTRSCLVIAPSVVSRSRVLEPTM